MYRDDLLTTCFGPKGQSSGNIYIYIYIKITKKCYWVMSGLFISLIHFYS